MSRLLATHTLLWFLTPEVVIPNANVHRSGLFARGRGGMVVEPLTVISQFTPAGSKQ
jgi:hypothetical protein